MITYLRAQWDRAAGVTFAVAGAVAIASGWLGVSRALLPAEQIPYVVSGGIGGLFLLGVGATLWLSADLRDEWRRLDALADRISQHLETPTPELHVVPDRPLHATQSSC